MGKKVKFRYDREGDILYIDRCPPYSQQESDDLGEDVIARRNPRTKEVESLEILFFSARFPANDLLTRTDDSASREFGKMAIVTSTEVTCPWNGRRQNLTFLHGFRASKQGAVSLSTGKAE